jgi:hypothetical protein
MRWGTKVAELLWRLFILSRFQRSKPVLFRRLMLTYCILDLTNISRITCWVIVSYNLFLFLQLDAALFFQNDKLRNEVNELEGKFMETRRDLDNTLQELANVMLFVFQRRVL